MKKINIWCLMLVALFLVLGLAKVAAASSQEERQNRIRMWKELEKIPAHSLSLIRPSDLAGILLLEDQ